MGSSNKEAELCYQSGLQLLHADKFSEAIEFFTKAISHDPGFAEAYRSRGELLTMTGQFVEGNTDLEKAKALRFGEKGKKRKKTRKVEKINLKEAESIYDRLYSADEDKEQHQETVDFDNGIYDYLFSGDTVEQEEMWDQLNNSPSGTAYSPAILEFVGGRREEVFKAKLFHPTEDEITIHQEESDNKQRIVPLRELCCLRLARLPANCELDKDPCCRIEIIETRDGAIYHEYIHPEQTVANVLLGFSTKENTLFPFTVFPEVNIKLRYQERYLGDILLEKRFISDDILKRALEEHQMLRSMQLGKIIARQTNILQSEVDAAISRAHEAGLQGLRTGEILLDAGLVNEDQIMDALNFQERMQSKKLGEFLIEKGILREKELYISLAEKFRIPFIDLRQQKISKKILTLLPREFVLRFKVLPLALKNETLVVATPSPDVSAIREAMVEHVGPNKVEFVLAQPTHLKNVVNILYQDRRHPAGTA